MNDKCRHKQITTRCYIKQSMYNRNMNNYYLLECIFCRKYDCTLVQTIADCWKDVEGNENKTLVEILWGIVNFCSDLRPCCVPNWTNRTNGFHSKCQFQQRFFKVIHKPKATEFVYSRFTSLWTNESITLIHKRQTDITDEAYICMYWQHWLTLTPGYC